MTMTNTNTKTGGSGSGSTVIDERFLLMGSNDDDDDDDDDQRRMRELFKGKIRGKIKVHYDKKVPSKKEKAAVKEGEEQKQEEDANEGEGTTIDNNDTEKGINTDTTNITATKTTDATTDIATTDTPTNTTNINTTTTTTNSFGSDLLDALVSMEIEVDADPYTSELRDKVSRYQKNLFSTRQKIDQLLRDDLLLYIRTLPEQQLKSLTDTISQDVVVAMKGLVNVVLAGIGEGQIEPDTITEQSGEAMAHLCMWQLVVGYNLRELEVREEMKKTLGIGEAAATVSDDNANITNILEGTTTVTSDNNSDVNDDNNNNNNDNKNGDDDNNGPLLSQPGSFE